MLEGNMGFGLALLVCSLCISTYHTYCIITLDPYKERREKGRGRKKKGAFSTLVEISLN